MWEKIQKTKQTLLEKLGEIETFDSSNFYSLLGFKDNTGMTEKIGGIFAQKIAKIKIEKGLESDKDAINYIIKNENGELQPIIE